jgi:hypothetical protein
MLLENSWKDASSEKRSCRRKAYIPGNRKVFSPGYRGGFRMASTPIERLSRNDFVRDTEQLHHCKWFSNEPSLRGIFSGREKRRER